MSRYLIILGVVFGVSFGPSVAAQSLDVSIVTAGSLDSADAREVRAFVDEIAPGLMGDAALVQRTRKRLTDPLEVDGVSVDFRIQYGTALIPHLDDALDMNGGDLNSINAMVVAGHLASKNGVDLLLRGLEDRRESVRYTAASSLVHTFRAAEPAIGGFDLQTIFRGIGGALRAEKSPLVIDALVKALVEAMKSRARVMQGEDASDLPPATLCENLGAAAIAAVEQKDAGTIDALLRGSAAIRSIILRPDNPLSTSTKREAAGFAGKLLVYVAMVQEELADEPDDTARDVQLDKLAQIAGAAEKIVIFSAVQLNAPDPTEHELSELVKKGKLPQDREKSREEFREAIREYIGKNGSLRQPPFRFRESDIPAP